MRTKSLLLLPALLAAFLLAAAPAADRAGSSEAEEVDRACDAPEDAHYDPPSGKDLPECQTDGAVDPSKSYKAIHYTNDVKCGTDDQLAPTHGATGVAVSGDTAQDGTGGNGYLQTCSDGDLPIQGRFTLEGEVGTGGGAGTFTADGDRDNSPDQLQGWAKVDLGEQTVTCGPSYAEGGRADGHTQADEGGQEHCG